eukprot:g7996.t1
MAALASPKLAMRFPHRLLVRNTRASNNTYRIFQDTNKPFASIPKFLQHIASKEKLLFFGEIHSEHRIVSFLRNILAANAATLEGDAKVHIVFEHFSLEMTQLLNSYFNNSLPRDEFDFDTFKAEYRKIGTENHNLDPYKEFLQDVHALTVNSKAIVHGGFIPRPIASKLYHAHKEQNRAEITNIFKHVMEKDWIPVQGFDNDFFKARGYADQDENVPLLDSSMAHQVFFKSLMGLELDYDLFDTIIEDSKSDASKQQLLQTMVKTFENDVGISGMFQAQLIKDACMGTFIAQVIANKDNLFGPNDKVLVVLGKGHCGHFTGAIEFYKKAASRLQKAAAKTIAYPEPYLLVNSMAYEVDIEDDEKKNNSIFNTKAMDALNPMMKFGQEEEDMHSSRILPPYADAVFLYDEDDAMELENTPDEFGCVTATNSDVKKETKEAYENVGASMLNMYDNENNKNKDDANVGGEQKLAGKRNLGLARALTKYLGYTEEEIKSTPNLDLVNFQGVGCPFEFLRRKSSSREKIEGKSSIMLTADSNVLDLGCGLGFDSFLAVNYYKCNQVTGVDLSNTQIEWCKKRLERAAAVDKTKIKFLNADIETLSGNKIMEAYKGTFSHVISNGAFCLLPNKRKGFQAAYDFLKMNGGVMAICCTVIKDNNENPLVKNSNDSSQWPLCMRAFGKLSTIGKMAEEVGFKHVVVDVENSLMEYNVEYEDDAEQAEQGDDESKGDDDNNTTNASSNLYKIHGKNSKEFSHLAKYNMNDLCCRVVVYGEK